MMASQNLNSVDFTKTQKFSYLENETFFSSNKKIVTHQGLLHGKNSFVADIIFKQILTTISLTSVE